MAIRIPWDEHEEAILLQALINVLNCKIERKQAISDISQQLRELAIARGIEIDEKYRNKNGISLQMSKLEYAFTDGISGMRVDTGWYFDITRVYRENFEKYNELLEEDMDELIPDKVDTINFSVWINKNNPDHATEILSSINILNALLLKRKVIPISILQMTNVAEIKSLIERLQMNKGIKIYAKKMKTSYMFALDAYKNYLLFTHRNNLTKSGVGALVPNEYSTPSENKSDILQVSFSKSRSYSYTRPSDLEYFGIHHSIGNWKQAYICVVKCLFKDYPDIIYSLRGKSVRGKGRIDFADTTDSAAMFSPQEIAEDLYLETNESANSIVKKIGLLLRICDVDYRNVKIIFASSKSSNRKKEFLEVETTRQKTTDFLAGNLSFYNWLVQAQGMAEGTGRSYNSAINTADAYVQEHNVGNGVISGTSDYLIVSETVNALFQTVEFVDFNQRQHNRYRAALRMYLKYLRGDNAANEDSSSIFQTEDIFDDEVLASYREIISTKFPKGFRIKSRLDMGRFRYFWEDKYGVALTENNEKVYKYILHITVRYQDFVYLPEMMMNEQTAQKLFTYLAECFEEGKTAVYYDALYKKFQPEFEEKRINNPEMLKSYLSFVNNGRFYLRKKYLTAEEDPEVNPTEEVRDYLIATGVPISVENLKKDLSHIDGNEIFGTIAGHNSAEFVRNQKGEYFHADVIRLSRQETDLITELIQEAIDDKEYMGGKELTDAIRVKLPAIMERYPFLTWLGLRDVIAYKMQDVFSFRGKIISAYGQDLSMSDVFAHFAATRDHFTLEQLNSLKRDLDTPIYFDSVYANSLRINKDKFVSRDQASFDTEATDAAISRFCTGDYISLKEISFFGSFPDAGFPWNGFLLEHYVADFSRKFKLLHIGFTAGTPVGAIVKRNSRFEDFDELVSAELAVSKIPLNRENALQYLVDIGLLARRNYSGIEQTLSRSKLQRSRKG